MILDLNAQHSLAIFQAVDPTMFDRNLKQWLTSLPLTSLAGRGILPPPGEVLRRPGYDNNDVRIQLDMFHATSGTVATTLDTVRLSIRAPPSLFLAARQPMLTLWFPISDWGRVSTRNVVNALQRTAHSLLHPYDPTETLFGQIFVQLFVSFTLSSRACTHVNDRSTYN